MPNTFILSQLILFVGLIVCVIIRPAGLNANDGISYYGTYYQTLLPYVIALTGSAMVGLYAVNKFVINPDFKYVRIIMLAIFLLTVGIVLTPYSYSQLFSDMHELFGSLTFILQGVLTIQVVLFVHRDRVNNLLILLELLGGLMSAYYLTPKQGLLIQGQMLFQLAFGLILIRSSQHLSKVPEKIKT